MPILTEQELQEIVNKETEAKTKIEERNLAIIELAEEKKNLKSQRSGFLASTVILAILFLALLFTVNFQPDLLNLNSGIQLEEGEQIVEISSIENYENRIIDLESQVSMSTSPLDLNEFYAVQLGAFKKFNVKLSSDDYSIVHNANFRDFNLFTLGVYQTEVEAEKLRQIVTKLDFQDAFVGYYKNGERVKSNY
ncbi:hypothetical protein P700755_003583 [Psychroflexus torquis ATCC 700755]|uniref:SPOR domain-containing protein n=1 Tax=Psychroflexus torquis (strain ATCC 700755 / CIP 106069 / ACAM 623) TaxID=313595 RepID=K4II09_PSYTT|nr:hypothetical protein [Psychroflexus torquis]AFU70182.1 hypothetical protein P700755_003583 [Psychroflexus torquis ATCC 700755]